MLLLEQEIEMPFVPQRDQVISEGHMDGVCLPRLKVLAVEFDTELDKWHVRCYPIISPFVFLSQRRESEEGVQGIVDELKRMGWLVTLDGHRNGPGEWY